MRKDGVTWMKTEPTGVKGDGAMKTLTVTTCGTSLLTNGADREALSFLRNNANKREEEYGAEEKSRLLALVEERRGHLLSARDEAEIRRLSAELNGFIGCYRRAGGLADAAGDMHFLICTDTFQGRLTAGLLSDWGEKRGIKMTVQPIEDLNTRDMSAFRLGINNLVEWCSAVLPGYRQASWRILFNLVGGFKSLQGYMQALGMFYADETLYIFEAGGELLSIPRLPVDFNESARRSVVDNFSVARRLRWQSLPMKQCSGLPETMLDIVDGECTFSAWGKLMFEQVSAKLYGERLLPPLSDRIRFSSATESEAGKLDPDKKVLLNRAIDNLSRFLENGTNLSSFDFRALKGDPKEDSTHEFNLWSTQNAWRGFCHYACEEGKKVIVVDSIDAGIGH